MKKISVVLSVLFILGWTVSCSNAVSADDVAKKFTESMAKGKFDDAKKHGTKSTQQMLDLTKSLGADSFTANNDYQFKKVKDSVVGDSKVYITYINPEGNEDELIVVKEDGKWLVEMGGK